MVFASSVMRHANRGLPRIGMAEPWRTERALPLARSRSVARWHFPEAVLRRVASAARTPPGAHLITQLLKLFPLVWCEHLLQPLICLLTNVIYPWL
jgi:hypothetical protein